MNKEIPEHYSLIHDHDDHFMVHDARDGKAFPIAKKHIHPANQIKLMRLKKFSDGGESEEDGVETAESKFFNNPQVSQEDQDALQGIKSTIAGAPEAIRSLWHTNTPTPPQQAPPLGDVAPLPMPELGDTTQATQTLSQEMAPQAQQQAQYQQPQGSAMAGSPYAPAFKQIEEGIKGKIGAEAQGYQDQQKAIQDNMEQMRQFNLSSQQEAFNKRAELDNMMDEMRTQKIDPNRFWASKDRGSRAMAGIALILGGIGSGLTHGPNMAAQQLDKMVDQDIDAQKSDINNKHTIYGMNLRRYGDQMMADQATRLQMNQMMQFQIQSAIAKSNSAGALAGGQQMLGNLKLQQAQLEQGFGDAAAMNKVLGVGTDEGGLDVKSEPHGLLNNKEYLGKRVVVGGKAYQAHTEKEGEELRGTMGKFAPIERDINKLREIGPQALADPAKYQLAQGIVGRLAMNVNEFNGYKRFTDIDDKVIQKQFNNPATLQALLAGNESNIDTLKALRGKMNSMLHSSLVKFNEGQSNTFQSSNTGKLPLNKGK